MIVAFVILVVFALLLYGMDYDLRCLRDEIAADEVGAGRASQPDGGPSYGLTAEAAAGTDDSWLGDAA